MHISLSRRKRIRIKSRGFLCNHTITESIIKRHSPSKKGFYPSTKDASLKLAADRDLAVHEACQPAPGVTGQECGPAETTSTYDTQLRSHAIYCVISTLPSYTPVGSHRMTSVSEVATSGLVTITLGKGKRGESATGP